MTKKAKDAVRHRKHSGKHSSKDTDEDDSYKEAPPLDKLSIFLFLAVPLAVTCSIGELQWL